MERKPYPSDVSDDKWALVAPYLTLIMEEAPQREHSLREVFNGLRWIVRAGAAWRLMPHDLPPWHTVYQQSQRWLKAKVFEAIVHDLREVLRVAQGRNALPSAAIFNSRTLQSTPESGTRAGYDGAKRRRGSKVHMAVDTLGHPDCHDVNRVGAKAANLSRLVAAYRIPSGFCVTAAASSQWAEGTGSSHPALAAQAIPAGLYNALASAYRGLAKRCGVADPGVTVRSSAVDEDGATLSFVGQYETYLHVVGVDAVAEAVARCWTSRRTARALAYRRGQGLSGKGMRLAVLIQQLVLVDADAVVFSANPVTGSRDAVCLLVISPPLWA